MKMNSLFIKLLLLRLATVILVQTWFVPDETWQATEVAHYLSFGYGYLCWEWKEGLRSILYPGIFSVFYSMLSYFHLDYVQLLIHVPRVVSAVFFAIGDWHFCKLSQKLFGRSSTKDVFLFLSTSWFLSYCAPRTLTSCSEMSLFAMFLYHFPWEEERDSKSSLYIILGGIGCVVRPTMALFILPYCLRHLVLCERKDILLLRLFMNAVGMCLITLGLDSLFYGRVLFVPWNFLKFNFLSGLSDHYGVHPWYWYVAQGLPAACGLHLVPFGLGIKGNFARYSKLLLPSLWSVAMLSCLGHKEFRFVLPVIPLVLVIGGDAVSRQRKTSRRFSWFWFLAVPNALVFGYMALIHQRGPLDTISELRELAISHPRPNFLFLTPCHSTPLYSHLHVDVPVRFLTCEPNLNNEDPFDDESDRFFRDPPKWIKEEIFDKKTEMPSHIIMFDNMASNLTELLSTYHYQLCRKVFNAHFNDGKKGSYFHIYCNS